MEKMKRIIKIFGATMFAFLFTTSCNVLTNKNAGTFTDPRDDQTYKWVRIGEQVWMAENLNYNINGSWCYDNNTANCDAFGRLYSWDIVMAGASSSSSNPSGIKGICPPGWHVPSKAEWVELINYVDANGYPNEKDNIIGAGNALKSCWQVDSHLGGDCDRYEYPRWSAHETHYGLDKFGFNALPGGERNRYGIYTYYRLGTMGNWWTTNEHSNLAAWRIRLHYGYGKVWDNYDGKSFGFSLRCVRDD